MFTGSIWSPSMRMTTRINVIVPDLSGDCDPLQTDELYVMYLLHGLTANGDEWPRFTNLEYLAKKYNVAFIMPDVDRSFYRHEGRHQVLQVCHERPARFCRHMVPPAH